MKIRIITIVSVVLLAVSPSRLKAQSGIAPSNIERVGQAGWQFLKINGDARMRGLGGAQTATAHGDASSVFGNPASLVDVHGVEVAFHNTSWIADIGHKSAVIAGNLSEWGSVAFSVVTLDYGDMAETINTPTPAGDRTVEVVTGNYFSAKDLAVGLTYSRFVTDRLSIGGTVKVLREQIAELYMNSWGLDLGTLYYTGFRSLRIGMIARNFGPDSRLVGWSEEFKAEAQDIRMPLDFRIGLAMDVFEGSEDGSLMTISVEGSHPSDGPEKANLGAEYQYNDMFFLRAGYRFNYDEESLTFGGGVRYKLDDVVFKVNYGYSDFGALQQVHSISLGLGWELSGGGK